MRPKDITAEIRKARQVFDIPCINMLKGIFRPGTFITLAVLSATATSPAHSQEAVFDCVIDPSAQVKLGSPVVGILELVLVKRGDTVKKGQVIAKLESGVEAANVELGRLRAGSTAEIEAQQARVGLIRNRHARAKKLAKKAVVTRDRMEELEASLRVNERELVQTKMKKRLAEVELKRSRAMLARRTIRSPIDGLVSERQMSPGEFVNQTSTIVTISNLYPLHVEAFVPVGYWGRINVGMTGTVELERPIGGTYPAKVTVVDKVFDAASATFGVRLKLPNADNKLPAGQRCKVRFKIKAL